jgi:hypothetical protein
VLKHAFQEAQQLMIAIRTRPLRTAECELSDKTNKTVQEENVILLDSLPRFPNTL